MAETGATLTFIGTATTLLRLADFTILTDPNFLHRGQRAYLGYGLWSKRRTEPSLMPSALPSLDAVVLSHLHGDHFDRVARRGLDHDVPVLTPPPAARTLRRWGFHQAAGLSTWSTVEITKGEDRLLVTAVPGVHGPGLVGRLLPPVMGSVLELRRGQARPLRLYLTGETLYRPMLSSVAERCGAIDGMVIHLGGTRILGVLVTMDAGQGVALTELLRPSVTVPVHFDDYGVFTSPRADFVDRARRRNAGPVRTVERGQTISLLP